MCTGKYKLLSLTDWLWRKIESICLRLYQYYENLWVEENATQGQSSSGIMGEQRYTGWVVHQGMKGSCYHCMGVLQAKWMIPQREGWKGWTTPDPQAHSRMSEELPTLAAVPALRWLCLICAADFKTLRVHSPGQSVQCQVWTLACHLGNGHWGWSRGETEGKLRVTFPDWLRQHLCLPTIWLCYWNFPSSLYSYM